MDIIDNIQYVQFVFHLITVYYQYHFVENACQNHNIWSLALKTKLGNYT